MTENHYKKLQTSNIASTPTGLKSFFGKSQIGWAQEGSESDMSDVEDHNQQTIDFKSIMNKYQQKTQFLQPFTKKVIEDVMFISEKKVVALEYIFYQNNENVHIHKLVEKKNYIEKHPLGIDDYEGDSNVNSAFKDPPVAFQAKEENYVMTEKHKDNKNEAELMGVKDNKEMLVEAMISIWNINSHGQIFKKQEVSFHHHSKLKLQGGSLLKLSGDKKIVSLSIIQCDHGFIDAHKVELLAWQVKDLKQIKISPTLMKCLGVQGNLQSVDVNFAAGNNIIIQKIQNNKDKLEEESRGSNKFVPKFFIWRFIDFVQEKVILEIDNKNRTKNRENKNKENDENELKFLGLLFNQLDFENAQEEEEEEVEESSENEDEEESNFDQLQKNFSEQNLDRSNPNDIKSAFQNKLKQKLAKPRHNTTFRSRKTAKVGEILGDTDIVSRLKIVCFFASNKNELQRKQTTKADLKLEDEEWVTTMVTVDLQDAIAGLGNEKGIRMKAGRQQMQFIYDQAQEKFDQYHHDDQDFFKVPKSWFYKMSQKVNQQDWKKQNYEFEIDIQSNKSFNQFSFLNLNKRLYLAFDNSNVNPAKMKMASVNLPKTDILANHIRNQQLKRFVILVIRVAHQNITATKFYNADNKKTIRFINDHQNCQIDMQDQTNPKAEKSWENHLQAISLTKGDQEIWMKTQANRVIVNHHDLSLNPVEIIERRTLSQPMQTMQPVQIYNLGLRKIAIQVVLKQNFKQFIYNLKDKEIFIAHLLFKDLEDIGFYPKKLFLEASSVFSFLTLDKIHNKVIINIMIVDPYYGETQFAIFRSTRQFAEKEYFGKKDYDVMVRNYAYTNKENEEDVDFDIKMVTQYYSHYSIDVLKNAKNEDVNDSLVSESIDYSSSSDFDLDLSDEEDNQEKPKLAPIRFEMDKDGHIFFVEYLEGHCILKEINPWNDKNPIKVYELKSNEILGFTLSYMNKDKIYLMGENQIVIQLQRQDGQKNLIELKELFIKDKDKQNFEIPEQFNELMIDEGYIIQKSRIFYLGEGQPLDDGILDSEELLAYQKGEDNLEFVAGPYMIEHGNRFKIVVKDIDKNIYLIKNIRLPDSKVEFLLNCKYKPVNLSTFLNNGQILIQIEHRYLIFAQDGVFQDQIEFQEQRQERVKLEKEMEQLKLKQQIMNKKQRLSTIKRFEDFKIQKKEEISIQNQIDKMKLHALSQNNRYFLFKDDQLKLLKVYKLFNTTQNLETFNKNIYRAEDHEEYEFEPQMTLDLRKSEFIEFMRTTMKKTVSFEEIDEDSENYSGISHEESLRIINDSRVSQFIADDGTVYFFSHFPQKSNRNSPNSEVCVFGMKITIENKMHFFSDILSFPKSAINDVIKLIDEQIRVQNNILEQFKREQDQLPKQFRNSNKSHKIDMKIKKLEESRGNIFHCQVFNDKALYPDIDELILVQCGRQIEYVTVNEKMEKHRDEKFKQARIHFDHNIIISKMVSTEKPHQVQIVGKDPHKKFMTILTWNFDKNVEESMFQIEYREDVVPENYVVTGMNQKFNYYKNQNHIFDLEFNIPVQTTTDIELNAMGIRKQFHQQRKIFHNSSRCLGINHQNQLNLPTNRMDLLFWNNVENFGKDIGIVGRNLEIRDLNIVYNQSSLYHQFVDNQEIMQLMCNMYKSQKDEKTLKENEYYTPLLLLNPDNQGNTALDLALKKQRTKSFELMIEMIEEFDSMSISKMMLSVIPYMIQSPSNFIKNFFDMMVCRPMIMQQEVSIPWPENLDEHIFPSITSLVNQKKTLIKELIKSGLIQDIEHVDKLHVNNHEKKKKEQIIEDYDMIRRDKSIIEIQIDQKQQEKEMRSNLHTMELMVNKSQQSIDTKRINVEAIDISWIFYEDNMKNLIFLLKQEKVSQFFETKAIRCFIKMIWSKYKIAIVHKIFVWNILYLFSFLMLAYFELRLSPLMEGGESLIMDSLHYFNLGLTSALMCFNQWVEFKKASQNTAAQYFEDKWNILDLSSNILNLSALIFLFPKILFGLELLSIDMLRLLLSICCFFMWVKSLYWLRLFHQTAYFVKLIVETFNDIKVFLFMLFIIITAFANCFSFMDSDDENPIIEKYTHSRTFNAFLSVWLLMLGEFNLTGLSDGPFGSYACWIFFILGSFGLIIMGTNMIIGIMTDTFQKVYKTQIQTSLKEKIDIIYDHVWLLDLKKEFKNDKYMIHISPETLAKNDELDYTKFRSIVLLPFYSNSQL